MNEPFALLMAFLPMLAYLGLIATVRVSRRAFATTGARDIAAVGLAMVGLVGVGPAQLFFPRNAAVIFGPTVWLAILLLYGLVVILVMLMTRPSVVVYGRTPAEVYDALLQSANAIDTDTEGDADRLQVYLPSIGVRLRCDGIADQDFARVLSFEPAYSARFWDDLLVGIRRELAAKPLERKTMGAFQFFAVAAGLALLLVFATNRSDLVVQEFRRWLWR